MSIQLVLMKSGEDVIADVYEMRDDEGRPQAFILRDPQIVRIKPNLEKLRRVLTAPLRTGCRSPLTTVS